MQTAAQGQTRARATTAPALPLTLSAGSAEHVADIVRKLYPKAIIRVDREANALIVVASPEDASAIRNVVTALDVKNPQRPEPEIMHLANVSSESLANRLRSVFPRARFAPIRSETLLVNAIPSDIVQIRALVAAVDVPIAKPSSAPLLPSQAFHITQASPSSLARAITKALPNSRVAIAGSSIIVQGPPDDLGQVKTLLEQLDRPQPQAQFVVVYRLHAVDASSVSDLLARSFPKLTFLVTKEINAISVSADQAEHARIADAIGQVDVTENTSQAGPFSAPNTNDFEILSLHAAVPSAGNGGASTTANDIAQTVTQALAGVAPDLKITVQPNSTRLVLTGSTRSRELARKMISQLDVAEPLVELDTRVLEIDEGAQTELGLKFPTPALATTYSEVTPISTNGSTSDFLKLQGLTRTPLTLGAQLDFLISNNQAKILEDPRITTFSGRTATLRAGQTVNILTTAGGGTGTVATTQIQSFQTGVTLDITPFVNSDDYITVTLHPSVNSIAGIGTSGVPNIQTRDTTTTIGLHDGETLIIGGLIEDTDTKTVQKIPILGDIPLIGRLFQDVGTSHTRNELVITVTPHILRNGEVGSVSRLQFAPSPLPTVAATATLPPRRGPIAPTVIKLQPSEQSEVSRTAPARNSVAASTIPDANASTAPIPNAFAQINTYTYGAAPQNNYADANQPPRIFFIRVQPTVVNGGTPVNISALTTTNVISVTIGPASSTQPTRLKQIGPGKWEGTFSFDSSQLPSNVGNVSEILIATNAQTTTTSVTVPFTIPK